MKAFKVIELLEQYAKCPTCSNSRLGKSEGTCFVTNDTFIRTCNCGLNIQIKHT